MIKRVLLLNSTNQALATIKLERAFTLLMKGKVEILHEDASRRLYTINDSYPLPEVIRLHSYVRIPHKTHTPTKKSILIRDQYTCQYCGSTRINKLTIDHIIPISKGGQNTWENLVACCHHCNNKKGDKLLEDIKMTLRNKPFHPTYLHIMRDYAHLNGIESWKKYIYIT